MKEKEAAVDPVVLDLRLLRELRHLVPLQLDFPKTRRRIHPQHRPQFRMIEVVGQLLPQIRIRQPVPICHREVLGIPQVFLRCLRHPAPRHVRLPRIGQRHLPIQLMQRLVLHHLVRPHVDRAIRVVHVEVSEIRLHVIRLEPQAEHKTLEPMPRILVQNMPQNRVLPDRHHRLRPKLRLLLDSRPQPSTEDKDRDFVTVFHISP